MVECYLFTTVLLYLYIKIVRYRCTLIKVAIYTHTMSDKHELKWLILNSNQPLLFKNCLKWAVQEWSLEDWSRNIGDEKLTFRSGVYQSTVEPQWERKTKSFEETFDYFLSNSLKNSSEWLYFDYKYLNSCFTKVHELRNEICWDSLGFPEIKPEDCTIWIGTKGAHTPCHFDSYGCNLVYQIYGKKLWLLFPPEENLRASRIPYEESSVYSKLNFFSPSPEDFKGVAHKCKKVILTPGDVLLVPNKWWHYVENLETSISINVWLPLPEDDEERLKEAIVQLFVKQISDSTNSDVNNILLNPNMEEVILQTNKRLAFFDTIHTCKIACQRKAMASEEAKSKTELNKNVDALNFSGIMHKYRAIVDVLPDLSREEFLSTMDEHKNRFQNRISKEKIPSLSKCDKNALEIFNVFTDMEVIDLIKNKILKKIST